MGTTKWHMPGFGAMGFILAPVQRIAGEASIAADLDCFGQSRLRFKPLQTAERNLGSNSAIPAAIHSRRHVARTTAYLHHAVYRYFHRNTSMPFERRSGILLHPTSLPGPHGSGDLEPSSYHFVDGWRQVTRRFGRFCPLAESAQATHRT